MPSKEKISQLFDHIAPDYDRLNHILSLNVDKIWRHKAVRRIVDTQEPLRVLDMACGTGDFAIAIAQKTGAGSRITGVDISQGMMTVGRQKVAAAKLAETIRLEEGDCEALVYDDGSFDRVSVAFGVRNFEHIEKGLAEMFRVLKHGGKLVVLELSIPQSSVMTRWYTDLYFTKILPLIGGKVSGDKAAYNYLPASVRNFPQPKRFVQMLQDAGFDKVEHKALTLGICGMYVCYKR